MLCDAMHDSIIEKQKGPGFVMSTWDWIAMAIISALGSLCHPVRREYKFFGRLGWGNSNKPDERGVKRPNMATFHNDEVAVYALSSWASVMSEV